MIQRIAQVDAFTQTPFHGNPAGVCVLERAAEVDWMMHVAREMSLSETAFLHPDASGAFHLRWFTPEVEVALCGHGTLASAHILWEEGHLPPEETAHFLTLSGPLQARREGDLIVMDFPALPVQPAPAPEALIRALGVTPVASGRNEYDLVVELKDEKELLDLAPQMAALAALDFRGVIVTAPAAEGSSLSGVKHDFVSRFFGPAIGVPEDPVTGSAHCALATYWAPKLGRSRLLGYQASQRGGLVQVELTGDRVQLGGQAVTVLRGELCV